MLVSYRAFIGGTYIWGELIFEILRYALTLYLDNISFIGSSESTSKPNITPSPPQPDTVATPTIQVESPSTSSAPSEGSSSGPPPPKDALEALNQRLAKYQETAGKAREEGNGSKARRMQRIVKVTIAFFTIENIYDKFLPQYIAYLPLF